MQGNRNFQNGGPSKIFNIYGESNNKSAVEANNKSMNLDGSPGGMMMRNNMRGGGGMGGGMGGQGGGPMKGGQGRFMNRSAGPYGGMPGGNMGKH